MARRPRLTKTRKAVEQAAAIGVARAGGYIVDLAQQLCPVDEGDLRDTGRLEPEEPALRMEVKFGGIAGPNKFVDYAGHVEYGTSRSPAQPFLTPAGRAISVRKEVAAEIRKVTR